MQKSIIQGFLIILISIFIIAFGMTTYRYYQAIHSDDPIDPYLLVERGGATIVRGDIAIDMSSSESYDISEGDIIITRVDSQAVLNWPDHSTTRLGGSSRLTIDRMRISDDYSSIEFVAFLESGKAWSNIVRTLYPDSRIEFRLPKNGTVAGVRGTVFDINLENNYIRSVDHSVALTNSLGQRVTLLPGEATRADNILTRIKDGLDTAWISANLIQDAAYTTLRDANIKDAYILLSGDSHIWSLWDRFVRWILSWFPSFRDISFIVSIHSGAFSDMVDIPTSTIMRWYQSFQSTDFVQERDQVRGAILSIRERLPGSDQIIDTLARGALWDMMSVPGVTLKNAQGVLDSYAQKTGVTVESIISELQKINSNSLTESGRDLYEKLLQ